MLLILPFVLESLAAPFKVTPINLVYLLLVNLFKPVNPSLLRRHFRSICFLLFRETNSRCSRSIGICRALLIRIFLVFFWVGNGLGRLLLWLGLIGQIFIFGFGRTWWLFFGRFFLFWINRISSKSLNLSRILLIILLNPLSQYRKRLSVVLIKILLVFIRNWVNKIL